jgi:hypothetical protein
MIIDRPFSVVSVTRNLFNQFGQAPCAALIATVMPTEGDTPAIFFKGATESRFRHDLHATYTKLVDLFASPSSSPCRCIGFSGSLLFGATMAERDSEQPGFLSEGTRGTLERSRDGLDGRFVS